MKARPDFLIIGTRKAGTTSLYHYLTRHPQVLPNKTNKTSKALHFFNIYHDQGNDLISLSISLQTAERQKAVL